MKLASSENGCSLRFSFHPSSYRIVSSLIASQIFKTFVSSWGGHTCSLVAVALECIKSSADGPSPGWCRFCGCCRIPHAQSSVRVSFKFFNSLGGATVLGSSRYLGYRFRFFGQLCSIGKASFFLFWIITGVGIHNSVCIATPDK